MSVERLEAGRDTPERVFGMPVVHVAKFAHHAGRLATAFGYKLPKGVEAEQVALQAAAAVPTVLAIQRGETVNPGEVSMHVDRATRLGEQLRGSRMPANFLSFINTALAQARGSSPAEMPGRIRAALGTAEVRGSMSTVEPFLRIVEQHDAGNQLNLELAAVARYVRDATRARNGGGKIDPELLAASIHEVGGFILDGRATLPMLQQVLGAYMTTSGKTLAMPAFEGRVRKNLTAAAPAIMEAVNAALPPAERDQAFVDSMRTSMRGKVGNLFGADSLEAIEEDVTPLLTHLHGMLSGSPTEARRDMQTLFAAA